MEPKLLARVRAGANILSFGSGSRDPGSRSEKSSIFFNITINLEQDQASDLNRYSFQKNCKNPTL